MPLSEEEQRILHEMEQKLYEHDRGSSSRMRISPSSARRTLRWAVAIFIVGFAILVLSFRSSLLLGTFGFLVMLFAALMFERSARPAARLSSDASSGPGPHARGLSEELSLLGRRLRSKFKLR